jgi:AcrR family transcriptional regulator
VTKYLLQSDGQRTPDRIVSLPDMDILQRQDAWSTVYIKRNQELIPGKPSADAFVYRTPDVQFSNPLHPTIDSDREVWIQNIGAPPQRKLREFLQALFDELFSKFTPTPQHDRITIQVETTYSYELARGIEAVDLPIFMQPPLPVIIARTTGGDGMTLREMLDNWTTAITTWFNTYAPLGGGTLRFDLTLMSDLTKEPMPLLRLRELLLPIANIQPPLTTM